MNNLLGYNFPSGAFMSAAGAVTPNSRPSTGFGSGNNGSGGNDDSAIIYSLPKFTVEDELLERSTLTPNEIVTVESDLMGLTSSMCSMNVGASGSAQNLQQHNVRPRRQRGRMRSDSIEEEEHQLHRLQIELDRFPSPEKVAYIKACSVPFTLPTGEQSCRAEALGINQMGRRRHWAYLESCDFDAVTAARRIVHYWEERLEVFGSDRAFLSMTLHGVSGRCMVFAYSKESMF